MLKDVEMGCDVSKVRPHVECNYQRLEKAAGVASCDVSKLRPPWEPARRPRRTADGVSLGGALSCARPTWRARRLLQR
eukprot:8446288-Lingulodinium_polyedra.AAC.1